MDTLSKKLLLLSIWFLSITCISGQPEVYPIYLNSEINAQGMEIMNTVGFENYKDIPQHLEHRSPDTHYVYYDVGDHSLGIRMDHYRDFFKLDSLVVEEDFIVGSSGIRRLFIGQSVIMYSDGELLRVFLFNNKNEKNDRSKENRSSSGGLPEVGRLR